MVDTNPPNNPFVNIIEEYYKEKYKNEKDGDKKSRDKIDRILNKGEVFYIGRRRYRAVNE